MDEWETLPEGDEEAEIAAQERLEAQHTARSLAAHGAPSRSHSRSNAAVDTGHAAAAAHPAGRPLTRELIIKAIEKQQGRLAIKDIPEEKLLGKQTHLHLNGMRINKIDSLRGLNKLETLYLYDNHIEVMENLGMLQNLTHLYLQNNCITQVTGLGSLTNLQKLYLQGNAIRYMTGLAGLLNLEELHVSNQRLAPGESMQFDASSLAEVAPTLRVLVALGCGLTDDALGPLCGMPELRRLELGSNSIQGLDAVEGVVRGAPRLMLLDLRGNPVCKVAKYREQVILMNDGLASLDDEPIQQQQREALIRLHIKKMKAQVAAELRAERGPAAAGPGAGPSGLGAGSAAAAAAGPGRPGLGASASPGARGVGGYVPPVHHPTRHTAPPVTAGFGAPRHLQKGLSSSGRQRSQPSIPSRGDPAADKSLAEQMLQGMQLGPG